MRLPHYFAKFEIMYFSALYKQVHYKTCAIPWQDFYFVNCNLKKEILYVLI